MKTLIYLTSLGIQFCPPVASTEFYELLLQFGMNLLVLAVLARAMYFTWNRNAEYMFAQLMAGTIVFMICAMLRWVQLGLGLALGLFAIFAIIRFRTINVPVKEMVYLFISVGISAVNALLQLSDCLHWMVFANMIVMGLTYVMEKYMLGRRLSRRTITFNNTELLKPSKQSQLLQELKALTELNIIRYEIGKVDYIKGQAQIRIYYAGDSIGNFTDNENATDDD